MFLFFFNINDNRSVPFERNRVRLSVPASAAPDSNHSYINASRVSGYRGDELCVVTQGPLEATVVDFWRLVWQEGAAQVVMLTRTFEFIKIMCVQYWPPLLDKPEDYGEFRVVVKEEECYAQYKVREMTLSRGDETRRVTHYQCHGWMAYATPAPNIVLQLRRRILEDHRRDAANKGEEVREEEEEEEKEEEENEAKKEGLQKSVDVTEESKGEKKREDEDEEEEEEKEEDQEEDVKSTGSSSSSSTTSFRRRRRRWPRPVVHCSDGGARSGMFAAVLDCLCMCEETGEIDVLSAARRLVSERRSLLTHPEHLRFVYDVIEDEILCGQTAVGTGEILQELQAKSRCSREDKMNDYEREHKLLESLLPR